VRQNIVVQNTPGALIEKLGLDQTLALQVHQPLRQFALASYRSTARRSHARSRFPLAHKCPIIFLAERQYPINPRSLHNGTAQCDASS